MTAADPLQTPWAAAMLISMSAADLLPELRAADNGGGISPADYAYATAPSDLAVALLDLFWPTFEVFEGHVFVTGFDVETLRGWQSQKDITRAEIEWFMNQVDFGSMFSKEERTALVADRIGFFRDTTLEIYRTKLGVCFPERDFSFSLLNDEECGFTFQQVAT